MRSAFVRSSQRGASLIVAMVLLAVLSVVGVAAVVLSGQERINAGAQFGYQALVECANAAQAKFWADLQVRGLGYLSPATASTIAVTSIRLPDGRTLDAPAHYGSTGTFYASHGIGTGSAGTPSAQGGDIDITNLIVGGRPPGQPTWVTARCTDSAGREHEVEFAFRFSF